MRAGYHEFQNTSHMGHTNTRYGDPCSAVRRHFLMQTTHALRSLSWIFREKPRALFCFKADNLEFIHICDHYLPHRPISISNRCSLSVSLSLSLSLSFI